MTSTPIRVIGNSKVETDVGWVSCTLPADPFLTRRGRKDSTGFIEYAQAVAWRRFKARPTLARTPRRHIDFRTEGSILTFALSKI